MISRLLLLHRSIFLNTYYFESGNAIPNLSLKPGEATARS